MPIRLQMSLTVIGFILFLTVIVYSLSHSILLNSFNRLDNNAASQSYSKDIASMNSDLDNLLSNNLDWAAWDDTYQFVRDGNSAYIENNLMNTTFSNLDLQFMIFADASGQPVYSIGYDPVKNTIAPLPDAMVSELLSNGSPFVASIAANAQLKGIITVNDKPTMVVSDPVLTSNGLGTPDGLLIWGRYYDVTALKSEASATNSVDLENVAGGNLPAGYKAAIDYLNQNSQAAVFLQTHSDTISAYSFMPALAGYPAWILRVDSGRTIYYQGLTTINLFLIILGGLGLLSVAVIYYMLGIQMIKPLHRLQSDIAVFGAKKPPERHIPVRRQDEIGKLADSINRSFDQISLYEEALRESELRFRSYFELPHSGIAVLSSKREWIEVNDQLCSILGYSRGALIKMAWEELSFPGDLAADNEQYQLMLSGAVDRYAIEKRFIHKNGNIVWTSLAVGCVRKPDHSLDYLVALIQDITDNKATEEEKDKFRLRAELSSRLAAIGAMVAGIAHEINNPLTGVIGFSELLMEENLTQDIKAQIKIISDGSHRVKDIVGRLLTFTRQSKPTKACTNINELIDATLDLRSYVLRTSDIEVIKHYSPDLPGVVADSGQLQQVFLNLIINAEYSMKKAHDKGLLIIITELMGANVSISFKDDGVGMSKETKEKAFNPFFTTKEVNEGTGLGLSLSRSIILEHGGTLEFDSEPDKGAVFVIVLPANQAVANIAAPKFANNMNVSPEHFKPAKLLVVHDEEAIRKLLSVILVQSGHIVDATDNFLNIFENLRTNNYDVVLMDIRMPGMSGIKQYELIIKGYPGLVGKFIFITGDITDTTTKALLDQNNLSYISKPFDQETLTQKVNDILSRT